MENGLDQKITEAKILIFHKLNISLGMSASNSRSNAQVGAKHIICRFGFYPYQCQKTSLCADKTKRPVTFGNAEYTTKITREYKNHIVTYLSTSAHSTAYWTICDLKIHPDYMLRGVEVCLNMGCRKEACVLARKREN
jgi:hypothetical protein